MHTHRSLLVSLALAGCSTSHPEPDAPPDPQPTWVTPSVVVLPGTVAAPPRGLDVCLGEGGELVEVGSVDNNDQHDHGALLTFGISPGGVLAAAGADGTLKFWTLGSELIATADGSALTYGSETGAVPITDLAFDEDLALAGDVRGLVQGFGADGTFQVLGGTTPDVPIVAVAFDAPTRRLAHAQAGDVVPIVVRGPDGSIEITETIDDLRDLAFGPGGELLVGGARAAGGAVEVRDALDARIVRAVLTTGSAVAELAVAREGERAAAVSADALLVLEDGAIAREVAGGASSVDLTPSGDVALTVGADGVLRARATDDGRELAQVSVDAPLQVRVDATGQRVIVGSTDAILHVFACAE